MKTCLVALSCCIAMAAACSPMRKARDDGYQTARVMAIERVAANAQHMENEDNYKISMRLGDTVYACHTSGPVADLMDWTNGKEFPAKLDGKVLLVKSSNGHIVQLNIVGKKAPK